MLKRFTLVFTAVLGIVASLNAQNGLGTIQGKIKDKTNGELLPFVSLVFEEGGIIKYKAETDFDGNYKVASVNPGTYNVKATVTGYKTKQIAGFVVKSNIINFLDIDLDGGDNVLDEVEIVTYQVPLINKDGGASGGTLTRDEIAKMPGRSAQAIANTVGGVASKDGSGDISIRGARADANYYFIDGVKVRGSTNLPKSAVEEISVITGGMPANYGDATGGIISITTRGPSSKFFGGVEYITSGYKFGDKTYGLDHYGYNLLEGSLSGPLLMKKDSTGKKVRPLIGFFISANIQDIVDPRPFVTDRYRITDAWRDSIISNPLTRNPTTGTVIYNTDFLRSDAFEKVKYSYDARSKSGSFAGKLDFALSPNVTLTFGGSGDINKFRDYDYNNMLFNSANNGTSRNYTLRTYGRFIQRFVTKQTPEEAAKKKGIRNAYYSLMVDYQKTFATNYDDTYKDDLFNYGYVGKFDRHYEKSYALIYADTDGDGLPDTPVLEQNGYRDTLISFTPSETNSDLAAITSQYYSFYQSPVGQYENMNQLVSGNALRNGDQPQNVYDVWYNIGRQYNGFGKTDAQQFRVTANGSADIGKHSLTLGFEYEQRTDRFFNVGPVGLWTQARLLQNQHINLIPVDSLKEDYRTAYYVGGNLVYDYAAQNTSPGEYDASNGDETQSFFDYNLRKALGLDPDGVDQLFIDSYDPSLFKLEFFSADELLTNGISSLVDYSGYSHDGKKLKGTSTVQDFFTQRDAYGNNTRAIGAFQPIYNSVYVMDKFAFDDLIFNLGLRVDRYDANQSVLKDKFLLFPAKTAGEITSDDNINGIDDRPSNIGDDYYVYINDEQSRTVTGYRNGRQWYNAQGVEVTDDPSVIFGATNQAVPVLAVKRNGSEGTHPDAFVDYKPQINIMPRIAFSFPINDEALFFAHYDILTKRPTAGSRLDMLDYYFITNRAGNRVFNNPNLKPEKTIDYELGFQQVLSKSSSLKIAAFYKEMRNMVTIVQVYGAYPVNYKSYDNIDFGTTKGMTLTYDLRRTKNLWMKASYTLQFAEGTGSNPGSSLGLINAGLPNLRNVLPFDFDQRHLFQFTVDYHYGEGKDYNGPRLFGKDIFANAGFNFVTIFGSGTPYTQWDFPGAQSFIQGNISAPVFGTINGARTPGQFRLDINIDKNIVLKFGGKNKSDGEGASAASGKEQKTANLNIYLWITNLLNRQNVNSVYNGTGNADDDGYLSEARYAPNIASKNDPTSFEYYYGIKMNNPYNYGLPRQIRLGIKLDF